MEVEQRGAGADSGATLASAMVVVQVATRVDVASGLIYTWCRQAVGVTMPKRVSFSLTVLAEPTQDLEAAIPRVSPPASSAWSDAAPVDSVAMPVEFLTCVRAVIDVTAPVALVTAR